MENLLLYIIYPIFVSIITLFINKRIEKFEKLKKEFFLEFYELYLKVFRSKAYNFTDLDVNDQNNFIDLIIKNEKYAKGILLELFQDFIMCISNYAENGNELNKIFNEIINFTFNKVCKRENKISKIECWKYNKKLKKRTYEDNQIFYINAIEKGNIIHTTDKND